MRHQLVDDTILRARHLLSKMGSIQPSAWTNVEEAPLENNLQMSMDYGVISGKVDLIEAIFNTYDDFNGDNIAQEVTTFNPSEQMVGSSVGTKNIPSNGLKFPNLEKDGACEPGNPNGEAAVVARLKEMIYRAAAMRPVTTDLVGAAGTKRRKNVRISSDPQTVAARQRRERINERLRILRRIVPGGSKMDTASMLDEAANYLKFLKSQINVLQRMDPTCSPSSSSSSSSSSFSSSPSSSLYPLSQSFNQLFPVIEGQDLRGSSPFQPF